MELAKSEGDDGKYKSNINTIITIFSLKLPLNMSVFVFICLYSSLFSRTQSHLSVTTRFHNNDLLFSLLFYFSCSHETKKL